MTSFLSAKLYQVEIVQFSFGKLGNFDGAKMTYIYLVQFGFTETTLIVRTKTN